MTAIWPLASRIAWRSSSTGSFSPSEPPRNSAAQTSPCFRSFWPQILQRPHERSPFASSRSQFQRPPLMKNTLETKLGLFFALVVIAAFAVLELIGGADFFKRRHDLRTQFNTVQDLKVGDPIKM